MKTLRLAFLAALAVGCHFDKLFQPSGSTHAPPAGSTKNRLTFTTQPRNTMKDSTIPPVQVTAFDSTGTVIATFTGNVTVAIGYNGGLVSEGQLRRGSTQVTAVNGVATFANLSIDQIGTGYTLTAAAAAYVGDTSTAFDVTATPPTTGPATKFVFVKQPTSTGPGATISPVQVAAVDDQNNIVPTFSGSITIAIGHNGGLLRAGTLSGTLLQPTVNGVATFADLSIDQGGTDYYMLQAGNTQLGNVDSSHFFISVL